MPRAFKKPAELLVVDSMRARADARRRPPERFADWLTSRSGSISFLLFNVACFIIWLVWNGGVIPGLPAFDPFPFNFLTMVVSLEAIILAIVVLISQNRASNIAELREELDLQVNLISEREITKVMYLLGVLLQQHGIDISSDKEIAAMLKAIEPDKMEKMLERQIAVAEGRGKEKNKDK